MGDIKKIISIIIDRFIRKLNLVKEEISAHLPKIIFGVSLSLLVTVIMEFKIRTKILPKLPKDSLEAVIREFRLLSFWEAFWGVIAIQILWVSFFKIFQNRNRLIFVVDLILLLLYANLVGIYVTVNTGRMSFFTTLLLFVSLTLILYIGYQFVNYLKIWVKDGDKEVRMSKLTLLWTVLLALLGLIIKKS